MFISTIIKTCPFNFIALSEKNKNKKTIEISFGLLSECAPNNSLFTTKYNTKSTLKMN